MSISETIAAEAGKEKIALYTLQEKGTEVAEQHTWIVQWHQAFKEIHYLIWHGKPETAQ